MKKSLFLAATLLAACTKTAATDADGSATEDTALDAAADVATADSANDAVVTPTWDDNPDCDPLQPTYCALPWPSSKFLVEDKSTPTGFRVKFGATSLPVNVAGTQVKGKNWERQDGFSVGGAILLQYPNVDLAGMATESDMSNSLAADAKLRLWSVKGEKWTRVPYWIELDHAETDPAKKLMNIRPGVILDAGTRYVVALTGLKDTAGKAFSPDEAFAALLAGKTTGTNLGQRQAQFDALFAELKTQGMEKNSLLLAWDFVTASDQAMHADMLSMRDQAMQIVGEKGPELTIGEVKVLKDPEADIAVEVTGTFHVPHFMDEKTLSGTKVYTMHRGTDGKPAQNGWVDMPFWVRIPKTALDGTPHGLNQYGHGLNGTGAQVRGDFNGQIGVQSKLISFACNWTGMSSPDVPGILQMIQDFSDFNIMSDHLQQGMMESLLLMRAMRERFDSYPEVKNLGVNVDKKRTYYTGISQGGIYGGTYMALSQDVVRGHLGVPGHSYSLLLQRSTDFEPFLLIVQGFYPDPGDRLIALSLIQMLWDAADPASYYVHLKKEPFPNTPPHDIMLVPAKGDFQVAPIASEIAARSGFVELMANYGRPVFGVKEEAYPYKGSGIVIYDFGNDWAPPGNQPPPGDVYGPQCKTQADCPTFPMYECDGQSHICTLGDPHDRPQDFEWRNLQLGHFLDTGEIIDVCGGDGCHPH